MRHSKFKHKEFSMGFIVHANFLSSLPRMLNRRTYKGMGRPKKSDYIPWIEWLELQKEDRLLELHRIMNIPPIYGGLNEPIQ